MTKTNLFYISHHFPNAVREKTAPATASFIKNNKLNKIDIAALLFRAFPMVSHARIQRPQTRRIWSFVTSPRSSFIPSIQPSIFSISSPQQTRVPPPTSTTMTTLPQTLQRYFSPSVSTTMFATFPVIGFLSDISPGFLISPKSADYVTFATCANAVSLFPVLTESKLVPSPLNHPSR